MTDATAEFVQRFQSLGLDGSPCSNDEIDNVEQRAGLRLPAAYRAYLRIAGRQPPAALVGSDCTIRHLPYLRDAANQLLEQGGQARLPQNAFVFLMHQGYQFMYFVADGQSDDPPVHYYLEGELRVVRNFERFSGFVATCVQDQ